MVSLDGQFHFVELRTAGNPGIGFQNCNPSGGSGLRFTAELGETYCSPATPNSTGLPGVVEAFGSFRVVDDDLTLAVAQLPPGSVGYFLASRTQGSFAPPVAQGTLCLGGDIARLRAPTQILSGPEDSARVDLTSIPANPPAPVQPGETWNFQCWYRDANPAPTSNFTDAISVAFH